MNIYQLFRILIESITWKDEGRKADALGLIDELEKLNAFGTVLGATEVTNHVHVWEWRNGSYLGARTRYQQCRICPQRGPETIEGTSRYR